METVATPTDAGIAQGGAPGDPFFTALLLPYRSLGRRGLLILFAALLGVLTYLAAIFLALGAWPVAGFFGLEYVLLIGAFWLNNRAARQRELVSVSTLEVKVERVDPWGRLKEWRFNPFWTRLTVEQVEDEGVTRIELAAREQKLTVGAFLNLEDRTSFARAFQAAFARAKRA